MEKLRTNMRGTVFAMGLSLLTTTFVCAPAEAILVELNPDMYGVGTDVSNLFEGATLSRYSSNVSWDSDTGAVLTNPSFAATYTSPVYVEELPFGILPAIGSLSFGVFHDPGLALRCWTMTLNCTSPSSTLYDDAFSALVVRLNAPTNFFEVAMSWPVFYPDIIALGPDGQMVMVEQSRTVLRDSRDLRGDAAIYQLGSLDGEPLIQTLLIGGSLSAVSIDRMRYNSVPEPSSLLLLGSGLAMLVAWRRKQPT